MWEARSSAGTRETHRAVYDALPLLKHATDVRVVELAAQSGLADARARLVDVVAWLHRHGVVPSPWHSWPPVMTQPSCLPLPGSPRRYA